MLKNEVLSKIESEAIRIMRNSVLHKGTFPTIRELMTEMGYKSPRSAAVIVGQLVEKKILRRKTDGGLQLTDLYQEENGSAQTIDVPLLGSVACGIPVLAEQNIDAMIPVSVKLAKPPYTYFFLRAKGDSMNERGINDGDMALIKQQSNANNGDLVVALIDDEATLKEFYRQGDSIILKPRSSNKKHQPILLTNDFQIQGVVITTIPA
jgi:repressor LexA